MGGDGVGVLDTRTLVTSGGDESPSEYLTPYPFPVDLWGPKDLPSVEAPSRPVPDVRGPVWSSLRVLTLTDLSPLTGLLPGVVDVGQPSKDVQVPTLEGEGSYGGSD